MMIQQTHRSAVTRLFQVTALACAIGVLTACSITPQKVSDEQIRDRVAQDQQSMYEGQEKVAAPISLDEAVARALKYNLDYRIKLMESALSSGLADVSKFDLLPNVVASAGYAHRDNESGGTSVNIATGAVSLVPSTSQERTRNTAGIEFSWNVLDFGVSYYRAHQQADQYLIAEERRKRVMQNIVQDVRSAYWRAVGSQRMMRETDALQERVRLALERSRDAEKQGLLPPKDALTYQRMLLDAVSLLSTRRQELAFAKHELRALMNVPPGVDFTLVESDEPALRELPTDLAKLEEIALIQRPELREEDYRVRVSAAEARKQLMGLLPGISFNADLQHDTNKYLYNQTWSDVGARVSLNLFKWMSYPSLKNMQGAQARSDEARRLALSMAVLTQVRVACERYRMALQDMQVANDSNLVDQRLVSYAKAGLNTRADSELELIRTEIRAINSQYQRYAAYAAAQTSYARIYNALGLDVLSGADLSQGSVTDVGAQVAASVKAIEGQFFPKLLASSQSLKPLKVNVLLSSDVEGDSGALVAVVERALARNHIPAAVTDTNAPGLTLQLQMQPVRDGVRKADWLLTLAQADGTQREQARYTSTLPASTTPRTLAAFAEAAAVANVAFIEKWLRGQTAP